MHNCCKVTDNIHWIGVNDRRIQRFENMFPLNNGVTYNSFLITGEKTCVMDAVDHSRGDQFIDNLNAALGGKKLDYIVVQHMEPDHGGSIKHLLDLYPEARMVGNRKTFILFEQFFSDAYRERYHEVKEGDTLDLGGPVLRFVLAPMVHWPEVMMTYEEKSGAFFSADAFGSFGAIEGHLFFDQVSSDEEWGEFRRYYTNIVGRHGAPVTNLLAKLEKLEINYVLPLHGRLFRNIASFSPALDMYKKWSGYKPEQKGVVIFYASMYGNMEMAIDILASRLSEKGVTNIRVIDVSQTHPSYIVAEAFKNSHFVVGAINYNTELYFGVDSALRELKHCGIKNRKYSLIVSRSWAGKAEDYAQEIIQSMKNMEQVGETISYLSSIKDPENNKIDELASQIAESVASVEI